MFTKKFFFVAILSMVCCSWTTYAESVTYYLPYYSNANGSATGVGLTNLSTAEKASATIEVYGNEGDLKKSQPVEIDLGGQWSGVVAFSSPVDGWLQIESNVPLAGLSFGIENGSMMDVPITDVLSNYLLVPHVAQDKTWDSVFFHGQSEQPKGGRRTEIQKHIRPNRRGQVDRASRHGIRGIENDGTPWGNRGFGRKCFHRIGPENNGVFPLQQPENGGWMERGNQRDSGRCLRLRQ